MRTGLTVRCGAPLRRGSLHVAQIPRQHHVAQPRVRACALALVFARRNARLRSLCVAWRSDCPQDLREATCTVYYTAIQHGKVLTELAIVAKLLGGL